MFDHGGPLKRAETVVFASDLTRGCVRAFGGPIIVQKLLPSDLSLKRHRSAVLYIMSKYGYFSILCVIATAVLLMRVDCGYLGGGGYGGGGYGGGGYGGGGYGGGGYGKLWQPYKFGYQVLDGYGTQHREEKSNGLGVVKGSYGYTDAWGHFRQVNYVADKYGFRAKVLTNEPGTANQQPAAVRMSSSGGAGHG